MIGHPSRASAAAAVLLVGIAGFQVALAAGAPWGRAAWGGAHPGVLPPGLRVASAGAVAVNLAFAAVAVGALVPRRGRRQVLWGLAAYSALGTAMNLASPSPVERGIWAPVALTLTVLFTVLARREGRARARSAG